MDACRWQTDTWELVKGKHSFLDSNMVQLGLFCELQLSQCLAAHQQTGILGNGVANGFGHKGYCSGCPRVCFNDVHLHNTSITLG